MTQRLDVELVRRGLARSRGQARDLVNAGLVTVNGQPVSKVASKVDDSDEIVAVVDPSVSRAAHKLRGMLDASGTLLRGRGLDAGASTGGFTQVLLGFGCEHVYAVDVGHGQLAQSLRNDRRVTVWEGLNLRDLTLAHVDGLPVDVLVADVSFISLRLLVEPMLACVAPTGVAVLLVKPQFEVGRQHLDARGVADPSCVVGAVDAVVSAAAEYGWECDWRGESPLPGASGNREFFVRLRFGSPAVRVGE